VKIVKSIAEMKALSALSRASGKTIGLVPTMGALHEGHVSLLTTARSRMDVTVVSIFVNPTQFAPNEDYGKYPRTFDADCAKAGAAGCDIVFAPGAAAMYPERYHTFVTVEELGGRLCGVSRPTHFRGVATVVLKFFNIVNPHVAFFGSKDAQQVIVLKRMVEDLHCAVRIEACPTLRERDGLAMSSRNAYLTPAERKAAPVIYQGLQAARALYESGERMAGKLAEAIAGIYRREPLIKKEYIEIVDTVDLQPLGLVSSAALIAIACRTAESGTRLIDNIVVGGSL
jgi:pantoate--beta-alanine ligase